MNVTASPRVVIGVTRCSRLGDYVSAVEQAGAAVRVLEVDEPPAQVLGDVDGVLLTGGADVDPSLYGEVPHSSLVAAEPGRDAFELDLARSAIESDLPVLAICRGVQVLNVAAGGTLVQDIPSALPSALPHAVPEPLGEPCHEVTVRPDSRLSRVLGSRLDAACSCRVNSRHHQAIAQVAEGFRVSAEASDGVIEAIEKPDARFCLGVQWHPENFWRTGEFNALFDGLVAAARQSRTTS
jgi:putative glutamine amidotransferase